MQEIEQTSNELAVNEPLTTEDLEIVVIDTLPDYRHGNARFTEVMLAPPQRPARYTGEDKQPAKRPSYQPGSTKSASAMLRGAECWTCKKSLSTDDTNGIGPRYCDKCLAKKRKSYRKRSKRINRIVTRIREEQCKSQIAKANKPYWVRRDKATASPQ